MKMAFRDAGWWKHLSSQQHRSIKTSPPSYPSCLPSLHLGTTKDRVLSKTPGQRISAHTSSSTLSPAS